MRFARAIAVGIARPFPRRMTHRGMRSFNRGVAVVFVGVDVRARASKPLHMRAQRRLLGVGHHSQAYLSAHPSDRPQHGRPVVGKGTASAPFIGPIARRVARVKMLGSFFARVLEHFIALGCGIGQSGVGADPFGLRKQAMPPLQDGFLGQIEFAGQVRTRLALQDTAHQQDQLRRPQLTAFEDRPAVKRVDALAGTAAIHRQATAAIDAEEPRLAQMRLTMRTTKAVGMEMLLDPRAAGVGIE